MLDAERVLRVVEMSCVLADCDEGDPKKLFEWIGRIYEWCHVARHECCNHTGWREQFLEWEKTLAEKNILRSWEAYQAQRSETPIVIS